MKNGIQKIKIKNYQSLKDVTLELGKVTIITGKTDSGKSALFRAVKGAVSNQAGDNYITTGAKKTIVALDNIRWIQSKKENAYEVNDRKWDKCGRGVPDEVKAELGMGEFEFGKGINTFLNFYGQLDRVFIIQGNPADNAKIIGSISNIHTVYNALRDAEKDTKSIKKRMTALEDQREDYSSQLKESKRELAFLDKQYKKIKEIYEQVKAIDDEMTALFNLKKDYADLRMEIKKLLEIKSRYKGIHFGTWQEEIDEYKALVQLKFDYGKVEGDIKAVESDIRAVKGISFEKGLNTLKEYETLLQLKSEVQAVNGQVSHAEETLGYVEGELKKVQILYEEFDVCDVCGAERSDWNK